MGRTFASFLFSSQLYESQRSSPEGISKKYAKGGFLVLQWVVGLNTCVAIRDIRIIIFLVFVGHKG